MGQTTRRAPDTTSAREALQHALRLLDDPRPEALQEARAAARSAAELVPYPWEQPYCRQYRKNMAADVCRDPACTRCAAVMAGDVLALGDDC